MYSIILSSLSLSLFFHNRESKQPDQPFSNTKALGDWRRLVSGCSFWRPKRAPLLVSCFLWWVLLWWGVFRLLPSSWRYTGSLHLRWERKQGMPGGMAGRLLLWPWVPPVCVRCSVVCLVLWDCMSRTLKRSSPTPFPDHSAFMCDCGLCVGTWAAAIHPLISPIFVCMCVWWKLSFSRASTLLLFSRTKKPSRYMLEGRSLCVCVCVCVCVCTLATSQNTKECITSVSSPAAGPNT